MTQFDPAAQSRVQRALERILTALARVLLRQGIGYTAFAETAKRVFVTVATEEFGLRSRPASKSRVALMTGLNRRDVARVQRLATTDSPPQMYNPALRIVSTWIRDPAYQDSEGHPRELPVLGPAPSIEALRSTVCPDVPITAVTRELLNTGVARSADDDATRPGRIALRVDGYVPYQDSSAKLEFMGTDVAALLETIGWNLEHPQSPKFQRKVSFNDLTPAGVAALTAAAANQGMDLLRHLDSELAQHRTETGGEFAGMGIYVFSESGTDVPTSTVESS
ncbi:DUF6502 family protein [Abyssibacter profundi]|nr:DUF6502 family protein [Abyssibacter profundi]